MDLHIHHHLHCDAPLEEVIRALTQGVKMVNATVNEIKDDVAGLVASGKALASKVKGLADLTDSIKGQLDTLIASGTGATPEDLNSLRDGIVSGKQQIDDLAASVDATVTKDTPTPPVAPGTVPATSPVPSGDGPTPTP